VHEASVAEIAIAAPLGFIVGLFVGLLLSSYIAVVRRDKYDITPRDHNRERGRE
jgi:hypothetical protein